MCNSNSTINIENCIFVGNIASVNEEIVSALTIQLTLTPGAPRNILGKGGGIAFIDNHNQHNSLIIHNCTFNNNSANRGGAVLLLFDNRAHDNVVSISQCLFRDNSSPDGGAVSIGHVTSKINRNQIFIENTEFINNSAQRGGAVIIYATPSNKNVSKINMINFINCTWTRNTATIGAALIYKPSVQSSIIEGEHFLVPLFSNCIFNKNIAIKSKIGLNNVLELGIVDITTVKIQFSVSVLFYGNKGSPIVARSAEIIATEGTIVKFEDNSATNGGAMALYSFSRIELFPNTKIIFDSNHASELGGAVYATSLHQIDFIYSHKCFISHNNYSTNPDEWNTSIIFTNNTAKYGCAVYVDSLIPCAKSTFQAEADVETALRWKPFSYTDCINNYTITTSPADIDFTIPDIAPGESVNLSIVSLDDLKQHSPANFKVTLDNIDGVAKTNPYISYDSLIQINGKPGTSFDLTLETQNTRRLAITHSGKIGDCPLGLKLENDMCVCSAYTTNEYYVGILECDMLQFNAIIQKDHWFGCIDGHLGTSYCPHGYCNIDLKVSRSCELVKEQNICTNHRRGQLCGECEEGYTVYYHSEYFHCEECSYGAVGLLLYIVAELIPLSILFCALVTVKLNMASGFTQSIFLFAQTITLINRATSFVTLSQQSHNFIQANSLILGFFNMEILVLDRLSFCLWKGATVLDNLLFNYVTTIFAIIFLGILIVLLKHGRGNLRKIDCKRLRVIHKSFKTPIIHSISTILILPYTHYTLASFQILALFPIYGEGGEILKYVVHMQGNVDYFGKDHLPYAIPALLVLIFLSIPPPLLLISYPLLWKIKSKLRHNVATESDTTVWPIRKLLPLIDSFQGVFRDNHRMFAGLLLLWRLIIAAIFAFSTGINEFFLFTTVALFSFFIIHAFARPYKRKLYNVVDLLMLGNMLIINILSWFIFHSIIDDDKISKEIIIAVIVKLFLMYLPLIGLIAIAIIRLLQTLKIISKNWQFHEEHNTTLDGDKIPPQTNSAADADEELFARAAELNNPPLVLTGRSAEFQLQTEVTLQE